MPNRIIREGILTSDRIAKLTPLAELFYRRLMSVVDDFGRYVANPTLLRASCYPLKLDSVKEDSIMKHLAECVDAELIVLYTVAGKEYLEIRDFKQYVRSKDSKFPACEEQMSGICKTDALHMQCTCNADAVHMRTKAETESKPIVEVDKELKSSPKENEEKEKPSLPVPGKKGSGVETASCRLPPQSAYASEPPKLSTASPRLSENLQSSFSGKEGEKPAEKTKPEPENRRLDNKPSFRGRETFPGGGKPGKLEMVWIASGKSKDEYTKRTAPPLPELSEDDKECLSRAGVELDVKSCWYYRRGKALIGEGRFSALCHEVKTLKMEGKMAKKTDTARFMSYLAKEVGK